MRRVIDTNRIMAGLLKDATSRRIILHPLFTFYAPDFCATELFRHRGFLMRKAGLSRRDFDQILHILLAQVTLIPFEDFEAFYDHAGEIMKLIDEDDTPFLAVGLALGIGHIWTEDRHFREQKELKVWSTRDLIGLI